MCSFVCWRFSIAEAEGLKVSGILARTKTMGRPSRCWRITLHGMLDAHDRQTGVLENTPIWRRGCVTGKLGEDLTRKAETDEVLSAEEQALLQDVAGASGGGAGRESGLRGVGALGKEPENQGGFALVHSKSSWLPDLGSNQGPTD